jgi:hypothetical protein
MFHHKVDIIGLMDGWDGGMHRLDSYVTKQTVKSEL